MSYDAHKKYVRVGACNHCGVCCAGCQWVVWQATRDIEKGETLKPAVDFKSICFLHDHPEMPEYQTEYIAKGCKDFPHHPLSTPKECSYRWIEGE